jgi:hypothetical protein
MANRDNNGEPAIAAALVMKCRRENSVTIPPPSPTSLASIDPKYRVDINFANVFITEPGRPNVRKWPYELRSLAQEHAVRCAHGLKGQLLEGSVRRGGNGERWRAAVLSNFGSAGQEEIP